MIGFINGRSLSLGQIFRSHGEFCASQPWEVIVATLTFLVCILTVWGRHSEHAWHTTSNNNLTASPVPGQAAQVSTARSLFLKLPRHNFNTFGSKNPCILSLLKFTSTVGRYLTLGMYSIPATWSNAFETTFVDL